MNLSDLKPGDAVMLCSVDHKPRHARVASVGRKNIKIEGDNGNYSLEDGVRKDNYGHEYLLTHEQLQRRQEVSKADEELRALGISLTGSKHRKLAPEILAAVRTVLP